jgi:hypothetical protein
MSIVDPRPRSRDVFPGQSLLHPASFRDGASSVDEEP